jgi:hemoglobin-like flavoprotein
MQRPDIERLRQSLELFGREGSEHFYRRLFALHPALRPLFGADIRAQARRFFEALDHLLDLLDVPEALRAEAERLGAAHAGYGVHEPDYDQLGAAWMTLLAERLGPAFSLALEQLWQEAYARIAELMIGASRRALTTPDRTLP